MPDKIDILYWENLVVPSRFLTQHKKISSQDIKKFAATFDPQPYHLDRDVAFQLNHYMTGPITPCFDDLHAFSQAIIPCFFRP